MSKSTPPPIDPWVRSDGPRWGTWRENLALTGVVALCVAAAAAVSFAAHLPW